MLPASGEEGMWPMRELNALREGWDEVEQVETHLLREMTIHESVRQWLILQRAFEPQLQQTADLFGPERQAALAELQARLRRLAEWQVQHGITISIHSDASATPE